MGLTRRRFVAVLGGALASVKVLPSGVAFARPRRPRGIWLAGDTHVHTDHSADGSLPRQTSGQRLPGNLPVRDQIGQAEATGLDFLPLTDHRTYDQHWDPQWVSGRLLLVAGEEANGSPHAVVLGAVDTIVDGANPAGSAAFRHVQQSIWEAHSQDAIWSTAHPDNGELDEAGRPNANASAVGVDTLEIWNVAGDPEAEIDYAEDRWNRGFRAGAVAASDNHFRELWDIAGPGRPVTWVLAAERSERAIIDALRAGRTTVSRDKEGPFVTLEADFDGDGFFEAMGGDEILVRRDGHRRSRRSQLRLRVQRAAGTRLLLYGAPGRSAGPVATFTPHTADETYLVPVDVDLAGDHSWYRAEVRSPGEPSGIGADPTLPDQLRAATSPVFVSTRERARPEPEISLPARLDHDDDAEVVLGEQGAFTGFPDLAVHDGVTHIAAEEHRDGRTSVVYRRFGRGRQRAPVRLSPGWQTARFPRVVAAGTDVWVVWQGEATGRVPAHTDIYLCRSRDGGRRFGRAERLTRSAGRAIWPTVAVVDHHPVVAWSDNSHGPYDVFVQVIGVDRAATNVSGPGKVVDPGTPLDARTPRFPASLFPALAVGSTGRVVVVWQDNRSDPDPLWTGHTPLPGEEPGGGTDPDNWEILASHRPRRDGPWEPAVPVSGSPDLADRHPTIAIGPDGTLVAAWDSKELRSSGVNTSIRASRSTDGGATWSTPEPVGHDPAAMSQRPRLGVDPDGAFRAVWSDTRSADWRWRVYTARSHPATAGWDPARRLSGPGNDTWPVAHHGTVVFTSDRRARRAQRDPTHEIWRHLTS